MNTRIVCAACRHTDGRIAVGPRHFDFTMWAMIIGTTPENMARIAEPGKHKEPPPEVEGWGDAEEGFIDQHGKFYTREEAWVIAAGEKQIIRDSDWMTGHLHSEHLY